MDEKVKEAVLRKFPDLEQVEGVFNCDVALKVPRESLLEVGAALREMDEVRADYLVSIAGVDYKEWLEVVYHLFSIETDAAIVLKVQVSPDDPVVPSVVSLWPTANWHERETYDLVGIRFDGHPDLRRVLLPDRFEGHPLRKDFVDQRPKRTRKVRPR